MEIRPHVTQYVRDKIGALRAQQKLLKGGDVVMSELPAVPASMPQFVKDLENEAETVAKDGGEEEDDDDEAPILVPKSGGFENVSVIRANAMKFLPNFFQKSQVRLTFSVMSW